MGEKIPNKGFYFPGGPRKVSANLYCNLFSESELLLQLRCS